LSRDPVGKTIRVELVVLPMARLQGLLAAVGPLAPGLAGIDVREPDGTRLGVNLLPSPNRGVRMDPPTPLDLIPGPGIPPAAVGPVRRRGRRPRRSWRTRS